jgi:hypothetical protein
LTVQAYLSQTFLGLRSSRPVSANLLEVLGLPGLFEVLGLQVCSMFLGLPRLFKLTWSRFLVLQACLRQLVLGFGSFRTV